VITASQLSLELALRGSFRFKTAGRFWKKLFMIARGREWSIFYSHAFSNPQWGRRAGMARSKF
jgi:hypothetical protein